MLQEIFVQPLTYREFLEFHNLQDSDDSLSKHINVGGLPGLRRIGLDDDEHLISDESTREREFGISKRLMTIIRSMSFQ